jgi:hypothetical protein
VAEFCALAASVGRADEVTSRALLVLIPQAFSADHFGTRVSGSARAFQSLI